MALYISKLMHQELKQWSNELVDEVSVHHLDSANEEGNENLFTFSFNGEMLASWGHESLGLFISKCYEIYSKKTSEPMWFYSWLDEQAGQLCISAVSQRHEKLPFSCGINEIELKQLVKEIFQGNSGIYTSGKLNLWKKNI